MGKTRSVNVIARLFNDFPEKFGIPRQSGLASLPARVVFEPEYRDPAALRGIEGFEYLWLIWQFSALRNGGWQPTVRPPRLGGNRRMGVFATRSPYRPNPIGLSSVRLIRAETKTPEGPVLWVEGADLMNGTPIYDIKPYPPYTDSHPGVRAGFTDAEEWKKLTVFFPPALLEMIPAELRRGLQEILALDPRPAYQNDPDRVYAFDFAGFTVRFSVKDSILSVTDVQRR